MRTKLLIALLAWTTWGGTCACCDAGSIWAKRGKNARSVYTDDVARSIGDILTILISEDSKVDNKSKRDLKKETARSGEFFGITETVSNLLPPLPQISMDMQGGNELKSKADSKDERT